jgi:glycosyltransferase involved in cell wall biosynthesis
MSRVLMLVINPMTNDTRVNKEAASLVAAGHEVTVVATAGEGLPATETRDGFQIVRVPYRRVVKDRVVAPAIRLRAARAEVARADTALRDAGLPVRHWVADLLLLLRRVLTRLAVLSGGAMLKAVRTRMLVPEYWGSIASTLPDRLERPDIIHAHDLGPLAAAARLAARWEVDGVRPKVVYDSHELYVEQHTSWTPRERRAWKLHERRWIKRADGVITVSGSIARELQHRYDLAVEPTVVLNSPPATPEPSASDVRTDAGLTDHDTLAVYVGTAKPGRGVDRLVAALPHGAWHLALVGSGTGAHVQELIASATAADVADRLHVLAGVPAATLSTYIRTADVGAHAMEKTCMNHDLALPNKLFDYLFAGLPVAVSNLTEMRMLVDGHGLGTSFDPSDAVDVARSVTEAAELGARAAATRKLLDELAWDRQAARLVALHASL